MPPEKKRPLCEIIFGQLRIPVSDKEQGKKVIEGIFMIGETGQEEAKPRGRRRGRGKAKRAKAWVKGRRAGRTKKMNRVAGRKGKGVKSAEIAKKPGVPPMTVG